MSERPRHELDGLADQIEATFCRCAPVYTGRTLVDPQCQAHDIADHVREYGALDARTRAVEQTRAAAAFVREHLGTHRDDDARTVLNRLVRGLDWRTGKPLAALDPEPAS